MRTESTRTKALSVRTTCHKRALVCSRFLASLHSWQPFTITGSARPSGARPERNAHRLAPVGLFLQGSAPAPSSYLQQERKEGSQTHRSGTFLLPPAEKRGREPGAPLRLNLPLSPNPRDKKNPAYRPGAPPPPFFSLRYCVNLRRSASRVESIGTGSPEGAAVRCFGSTRSSKEGSQPSERARP